MGAKDRYETNKWEAVHVASEEGVAHFPHPLLRLKVPGGWFVKAPDQQLGGNSMVWYPDEFHAWQPPLKTD